VLTGWIQVSVISTAADGWAVPFDEVYETYRDAVYRFCLSQTTDRTLAEDLTADVFLLAYKAYTNGRFPVDRVRVWLFRIARNAVIDNWRRERTRRLHQRLMGRDPGPAQDVEAIALGDVEFGRMVAVMSRLKPRDRLLLALRFSSDLSGKEIAGVLQISENNQSIAMHRAIARFRKLYEESA
jgi:RNA polymerase sigma-70 factor (ECF subfamily)